LSVFLSFLVFNSRTCTDSSFFSETDAVVLDKYVIIIIIIIIIIVYLFIYLFIHLFIWTALDMIRGAHADSLPNNMLSLYILLVMMLLI